MLYCQKSIVSIKKSPGPVVLAIGKHVPDIRYMIMLHLFDITKYTIVIFIMLNE